MRRVQAVRNLRHVMTWRGVLFFLRTRATWGGQLQFGAHRRERLWHWLLRDVRGFNAYVNDLTDPHYSYD